MSKNGIRGYIILAVLAVVLSVIAFAAPFTRNGAFWVAYVFGMIANAYQIYVFKVAFSAEGDVKSKFYGFPIARIGLIYLVAQLAASLVEMAASAVLPIWAALILNVLLLAFAAVGCIAADMMRDEIERQDVQVKVDVSNMRTLQSMSAALAGRCSDADMKKAIEKLAEEFKYSDPVSSDATVSLEAELKVILEMLQDSVLAGDAATVKTMAAKAGLKLEERNRVCAMNK